MDSSFIAVTTLSPPASIFSASPMGLDAESNSLTVIFGVLGLSIAIVGIAVPLLQLRRMAAFRVHLHVFELA